MASKSTPKPEASWEAKNPGKQRCPFVWEDGHRCTGHISEVHELSSVKVWRPVGDGWRFNGAPSPQASGATKFHAICSTHGAHGGANGFRQNGVIADIDGLPNPLAQQIEWARTHKLPGGR